MPLLDLQELEALRRQRPHVCERCGRAVNPNYCRQCDEYFPAGHLAVGTVCEDHARHDTHRTY